jgi:hypothetical protein
VFWAAFVKKLANRWLMKEFAAVSPQVLLQLFAVPAVQLIFFFGLHAEQPPRLIKHLVGLRVVLGNHDVKTVFTVKHLRTLKT